MKIFYSDTYPLPLPEGHRFPVEKYRLLRERLLASAFRDRLVFCPAVAATDEQLLLVHTQEYLSKLKQQTLSRVEERRIGFPCSQQMVERSRRSTGATLNAAQAAIREQAAVHLAGGTHHAFRDHGQGFCVFNDVAVAIRCLQTTGAIRRTIVLDLDVHQGNGTAAIFAQDTDVFTVSMHGEKNFPFRKCDGDLDIALPDGTGDDEYLERLRIVLAETLPFSTCDLVFYLAGADPYEHDRLGKLKLTKGGLERRDRAVFDACKQHDVAVAVVMAGGYAREIQDVVEINTTTVRTLLDQFESRDARSTVGL